MSQEFKGFVVKLTEKRSPPESKRKWILYSVKLEKRDGTEYEDWVSLGFDDPGLKEGDYVAFQASQENGRWRADPKTIQKSKNPPARASRGSASAGSQSGPAGTSSASVGGGNRFDGTGIQNRTNPEDARRMAYANARSAAIEVARLLIETKGLPFTKADTKAGEAKRFDEITAGIDKLTVKFFNDGVSLRLLETVADTAPSTAPDGELPDVKNGEDSMNESLEPNDTPEDDEGFDS
jgi:hypothetical protein